MSQNQELFSEQATKAINCAGQSITAFISALFLLIAVTGESITKAGEFCYRWWMQQHNQVKLDTLEGNQAK